MKILIAEDEPVSQRVLHTNLEKWDYEVISCEDGAQAWEILQDPKAPSLAILDWMMPYIDGVELCRRVRQLPHGELAYIILLTAKNEKSDIIQGLSSGANDYATKPCDTDELKARVRVGQHVIDLQNRLLEAERNRVITEAAGAAAHEINQPLTVLVGTAELLMYQMEQDAQHRESIESMHEAAQKISKIVKQMSKIRQYVTKPYLDGINIIDFDAATSSDESDI